MNKTFFNVIVALAIVVFIGAWAYSGKFKSRYLTEAEADPQAVLERIRPVGEVAIEGMESPQSIPAEVPPPVEQPVAEVIETVQETTAPEVVMPPVVEPAATNAMLGEETYKVACIACHMTGIAGAPKQGDVEAWAPRIAQGMDLLNEHALKGFQGSTGIMPPKGGRVDLSDEAIIAAVAYMVEESGGQ